jgi:hypothetical protein
VTNYLWSVSDLEGIHLPSLYFSFTRMESPCTTLMGHTWMDGGGGAGLNSLFISLWHCRTRRLLGWTNCFEEDVVSVCSCLMVAPTVLWHAIFKSCCLVCSFNLTRLALCPLFITVLVVVDFSGVSHSLVVVTVDDTDHEVSFFIIEQTYYSNSDVITKFTTYE